MGAEKTNYDPEGYEKTLEFQMQMARIEELLHAVQTGVGFEREFEIKDGVPEDRRSTGPKHMRTGVDSAMCQHGALVALLVKNGTVKYKDYLDAEIVLLEREVAMYEARLKKRLGTNITLH